MRDIKELEHDGDRLTHEVVDLLNRTFVTPFDRDDMYRLAGALDDICDHVDEAAEKIALYGVREVPRAGAREQADVILARRRSCSTRRSRSLEGFKDSKRQLIELRELEDEGDRLVRATAIAELFRGGRRRDRAHPLEGHPRAARGSRRRLRERRRRARGDPRQEPLAPWSDVLLVVVVVVALGFDFTNGFHDTANAVATSVSTRALSPRLGGARSPRSRTSPARSSRPRSRRRSARASSTPASRPRRRCSPR